MAFVLATTENEGASEKHRCIEMGPEAHEIEQDGNLVERDLWSAIERAKKVTKGRLDQAEYQQGSQSTESRIRECWKFV